MLNNQQITNGGIPQQSGLDIFSSIINYTGEFLGLGQPLLTSNIDEAVDYATIDANPQLDAVTSSYPAKKKTYGINIILQVEEKVHTLIYKHLL